MSEAIFNSGDMEEALRILVNGAKRIAIIFDVDKGWCVTDQIDVVKPRFGPIAPEFNVITYQQWTEKSLESAMTTFLVVKKLRADEMKVF